MNAGDIHVVGVSKPDEQYLIMFRRNTVQEALHTLRKWARDPELSFSDKDAYILTTNIHQLDFNSSPDNP